MVPIMESELLLQIILAIIAGGGGLTVILKFITDWRKHPLNRDQAKHAQDSEWVRTAREGEAAAKADAARAREGEDRARAQAAEVWDAFDAFRQSSQEEATKTRNMAEEALANSRRSERKADEVTRKNEGLTRWIHQIHENWPTVRLQETPPPLPPEAHTGPTPTVRNRSDD
jgi:hypothetical protein